MNPEVDAYVEGSDLWPDVITALRPLLIDRGLSEEIKWRQPCYVHEGKNIVILQEMKAFLSMMFFKGALLDDPDGVLVDQGPNSRSARRIELASTEDVARLADTIGRYVDDAIAVEEAGLTVEVDEELVLADELQERLDEDPELRAAFEALTPGRQRAYNLHIAEAKQAKTRVARVNKHVDRIKAGKGLNDR